MRKTLRYRVKDKHAKELARQARAVNFVWNYCNETQRRAVARGAKWPTRYDLTGLTTGTGRELGLASGTVEQVCVRFVESRRISRRRSLRWRGKRSLGWVPIRGREIHTNGPIRFRGVEYSVWLSRPVVGRVVDGSSFSQDARGRWYLNLAVETEDVPAREIESAVGIDLGLKDFATLSTGEAVAAPQFFRGAEEKLAIAARAGKRGRVRDLHAKIANQRRDFHHKLSTRLVREFDLIAVGDVGGGLARTSMAKSVHDAGWTQFRGFLRYKAIEHGATYREVREQLTTQTCSDCGFVGGPKGRKGLRVRLWTCVCCGSIHDRDVNAARNIVGLGHEPPGEGIGASHD